MFEVLQELQLAVCSLCENRSAERLHNLLDSDILVCELISCRAVGNHWLVKAALPCYGCIMGSLTKPNQTLPYQRVGGQNIYNTYQHTEMALLSPMAATYLDVISNVVPKIWARTNSAIVAVSTGRRAFCSGRNGGVRGGCDG